MGQPTPFNRGYSFTDFASGHPSTPLPGVHVDSELDAIAETLAETLANLALIQRDDGKLADDTVTVGSLSDEAIAFLNDAVADAAATAQAANTDAQAAKVLAQEARDAAQASATAANGSATAAAGSATAALASKNAASASATAAGTSEANAAASAGAALASKNSADADATAADGSRVAAQAAKTAAETARDAAAASATAADGSKTAAAGSATAAANSATAANTSAGNAATSEGNAAGSAAAAAASAGSIHGIPAGGANGYVLAKSSAADYAAGWVELSGEPAIAAGTAAQYWRGDKTWQTLNKAAVGLGNVDNTSDANKPVSTAQQTALDAKLDDSQAGTFGLTLLGSATLAAAKVSLAYVKGDVGLGSVDNTADAAKAVLSATKLATPRTINGVAFDGTGNITINAVDATSRIATSLIGAANGVVPTDGSNKIPTSFLPALAITSTSVVASQAAQLALVAEEGDVAIRSDLNKSFIRNAGTAGTMADWNELLTPTDAVLSVNGQTGAVSLTTTNIAEGTNLYFTAARVLATAATGLVDTAGTPAATDTILTVLGKIRLALYTNFGANVIAATLTGLVDTAGTPAAADSILTAMGKIKKALFTDLPTTIRGTVLTGLAATAGTPAAADSILTAIGKLLQAVYTDLPANYAPKQPQIQTVASAATVTPTFANDAVTITAQAAALTLANWTGTAQDFWGLVVRIKDNGTARTIAYGANYAAADGVTLPTTTVVGKTHELAFEYNSVTGKYVLISALTY